MFFIKKGFTILELIIALALFTLLASIAYKVYQGFSLSYKDLNTNMYIEMQCRNSMNIILSTLTENDNKTAAFSYIENEDTSIDEISNAINGILFSSNSTNNNLYYDKANETLYYKNKIIGKYIKTLEIRKDANLLIIQISAAKNNNTYSLKSCYRTNYIS